MKIIFIKTKKAFAIPNTEALTFLNCLMILVKLLRF